MKATFIEDACELITDGTHYTPPDIGEGFPFLTVKDMSVKGLDFVHCSHISPSEYAKADTGKSSPKIGDVLFSKDGTVGKVHVVSENNEFAILSSIAILRPKKDVLDSNYFGYVLRSPITLDQAVRRKTGSAIRRIILKDLKRVKIPLPPLDEQKRIAAILDKADAIRRKRKEAIALTEELLRSTFLDMFGDPLSCHSDSISLGKCADVIMGQSPPGTSYNREGYGTPLLNGPTEFGNVHPIEQQWTTKPKKLCFADDVLFCVRGATAGRLNVADKKYCIGRGIAAIRPKVESTYNASFLYAILERYYNYFQQRGVGSTFINISYKELTDLPIPKSNISTLRNFNLIYGETQKNMNKLNHHLHQSDNLFNSLLQKAFCGEL
ncbi:restriction endonuclease subunit S [Crocosphaera sp. XPORK-15E]|uniref:restriction endonuclease subunit S n=1 Tax=Crocosphaera sp. XPORK-15E TaxID=3110247 RepID=UPI002B21A445|nr:restriction endonuclease subunit S [Crocosphaera sp. XPORK-15E]MEA5535854.1 restriction endonuclease subunit S [Crocosphaera sp. XPORK-15E]